MGEELLLERCFPPSTPPPLHVLIWMGKSMASSNTCSMPPCPPPSFHHQLPRYQPVFLLSNPSCSVIN
ncbi:hypothetical protein CesoFtcFv8_020256 [Champsocephalus esox]|uniref:Uncharacterized protein n=1 Tax=Champsocephalus esox TaxID=159716 RepID=A0AAN8BFF3_9TELE|nr:hypothetical protein CesoFtcFv8_020256 [Champsocephalus esox]